MYCSITGVARAAPSPDGLDSKPEGMIGRAASMGRDASRWRSEIHGAACKIATSVWPAITGWITRDDQHQRSCGGNSGQPPDVSGLIPDVLITLPHLSTSAAM